MGRGVLPRQPEGLTWRDGHTPVLGANTRIRHLQTNRLLAEVAERRYLAIDTDETSTEHGTERI